jgi:Protein of unknown function (DUF1360)
VERGNVDGGLALRFALGSLATWRVTHLLARENGPGDIVARTREAIGEHRLGDLLDCFACTSVWVAAAMTPSVARRRSGAIIIGLALSGAACLLDRLGGGEPVPAMIDLQQEEGGGDGMLR